MGSFFRSQNNDLGMSKDVLDMVDEVVGWVGERGRERGGEGGEEGGEEVMECFCFLLHGFVYSFSAKHPSFYLFLIYLFIYLLIFELFF